ncbi:hypothetical protein P3S67_006818 [Capsicum chacoense]
MANYVDKLLNLELPDEKSNLSHGEIVALCSEFLNAGTDMTSTALQWLWPTWRICMKLPYLKAVILEGLRRHPPGHFLLSHTVTEEVELNGYVVPKNAAIYIHGCGHGFRPKCVDVES